MLYWIILEDAHFTKAFCGTQGRAEEWRFSMASNPNYCDITPEIEALAAQSLQNSSIDAGDYVR